MTVFSINKTHHTKQPMFFGDDMSIQRYDMLKYRQFDKFTDHQLGFFWRPEEIDLNKDNLDFQKLTEGEQHIFTSNLKRQIMLDTVQGRSPNLVLLPIVSIPELEAWVETWSFSEVVHSRSYTHIIRNLYTDPSIVFDSIETNENIVACANDIAVYYDNLHYFNVLGEYRKLTGHDYWEDDDQRIQHKKALWMCLNAINALEGVRFYVSFACSWAFAELGKMIGNADIIQLIGRDENLHLASTQTALHKLPQDDPEFELVKVLCEDEVYAMFQSVIEQEKEWAKYLFKEGTMLGLNEDILCSYVDYIAIKRMRAIGLKPDGVLGSNPLPWTEKWIKSSSVQTAAQEKEITSYVQAGIEHDFDEEEFLRQYGEI